MTERKGEKVLNLQSLYTFVLQDICKRERFWWRRLVFSFQFQQGTPLYDLTTVTTTPATAMSSILLDEITKLTIILSPSPYQIAEFVPTFDPEAIIDMNNNTSLTPPTGNNLGFPGGRYTMDPSGINVIRVDPPDMNYTAWITGWAMPAPATDSTSDAVPLIPAWGHNTIVAGMNAKIFKFAYGSRNEKTLDAIAEYEQGIQDLAQRKQFDPNYRLQMSLNESAVRST